MTLTGLFRIGRDAELRMTPAGDPIISLSLAYNYGKKDATGRKPSQWIEASLWGNRAESAAPYLKKGAQIFAVIGEPHIETFTTRDNKDGHKLTGRILEFDFAGGSSRQPASHQDEQHATSAGRPGDDIPF